MHEGENSTPSLLLILQNKNLKDWLAFSKTIVYKQNCYFMPYFLKEQANFVIRFR